MVFKSLDKYIHNLINIMLIYIIMKFLFLNEQIILCFMMINTEER